MLRDLLQNLLRAWGWIQTAVTTSGSRTEIELRSFSELRLHTVGSSLGGEGLYGWHSEQEGDPPGGRVPFKFLNPAVIVPTIILVFPASVS